MAILNRYIWKREILPCFVSRNGYRMPEMKTDASNISRYILFNFDMSFFNIFIFFPFVQIYGTILQREK